MTVIHGIKTTNGEYNIHNCVQGLSKYNIRTSITQYSYPFSPAVSVLANLVAGSLRYLYSTNTTIATTTAITMTASIARMIPIMHPISQLPP